MNPPTKPISMKSTQEARISEADRTFCQAHQRAYDAARESLQEFEFFWECMQLQQEEALAPDTGIGITSDPYLTLYGRIDFSVDDIRQLRQSLHNIFIHNLVSYFNRTYLISIQADSIKASLLPHSSSHDSAYAPPQTEEYAATLVSFSLHYTDVLGQIFLQTGGRDLLAAALIELKKNCSRAAWNSDNNQANFKLKKNILQLRCACNYQTHYPMFNSWELYRETLDILTGIAHFEADGFSGFPDSLSLVIQDRGLNQDSLIFTGCRKAHSMKLHKNHRGDIRFHTEEHARKFVEEYLGTVPPC